MAQLNQADIEGARQAVARTLFEEGTTERALDVSDIKQFFCENWEMIKKVLKFLADSIGGPLGWAARALIAAGDFLHGRICP